MEPSEFEAHCKSEKSHKQALEFTSFGDKAALSGGNYTSTAAARINPNDGELDTLIVQKYAGDHGSGCHSMSLDRTGKSAPYDIDPSDKTAEMHSVLIYGEYLLSFLLDNGPLCISKLGKNVYKGAHQIKKGKCRFRYNGNNTNRNVQLEGDMLYFIDTNCHVVQYDLKELLSLDEKSRSAYQPTVHSKAKFEDFCVFERRISTLTKDGLLTDSDGRSKDLKTLANGSLGQYFLTLETLAGYYVVASYTASNSNVYSVLSAELELLAFHSVAGASNQNVLLYSKNRLLHILGGCDADTVDLLVYNDKRIELVKSFKVSDHFLNGLVWLKPNEEALVLGGDGFFVGRRILKRLKLT